jgi:UDP-GlcNAc:undecaprenyl-phosphate GlcNAc-1-phosphate transferase
VLALLIALWVRFTQNRVFAISGLDFLIVFIAVVVPNVPGFLQPGNVIGAVAIESIILFYAVEVLLSQKVRAWDMLRFSTLGTLAVLSIRAFL